MQHTINLNSKSNVEALLAAESGKIDTDCVELCFSPLLREKMVEGDYLVINTPEGTWLGEVEENDGYSPFLIVSLT